MKTNETKANESCYSAHTSVLIIRLIELLIELNYLILTYLFLDKYQTNEYYRYY